MSGGSWNYLHCGVAEAADRLHNSTDPLRQAFGHHLLLVAKALHDIEWVDSGDLSHGDEHAAIKAVLERNDSLAKHVSQCP